MGVIKLLDKQVAELIAAGEVVERPASIVKELVENSLDAGATRIVCEMKGGGIRYLRITDDGTGIAREDISNAFLRHATSKVSVQEDLDRIGTFGFRGEALASIAAMCKVELISRTKEETVGTRFVIEGSKQGELFDIGCPIGTSFIVRDVFFNTPARLKFLKKDSYEGSNVVNVLEKLAIVNSDVSFKLIRDGNTVLDTPGNGDLLATIHSIMGGDFAKGLIKVEYRLGMFQVHGYITDPSHARATRALQSFFINSRFVRSKCCIAAMEEAYKGSVMGGKFPGCVLNVILPVEVVDVNVHPAKIEVRFSDENAVYQAVFAACKSALQKNAQHTILRQETPKSYSSFALKDFDHTKRQTIFPPATTPPKTRDEMPTATRLVEKEKKAVQELHQPSGAYRVEKTPPTPPLAKESLAQALINRSHSAQKSLEIPQVEEVGQPLQECNTTDSIEQQLEVKVIGEVFSTYILVEKGDTLILIDKHAAHERYLYEQLRSTVKPESQILLVPQIISLDPVTRNILLHHQEKLIQMGFSLDCFGEKEIAVREIPTMLPMEELTNALEEISENLERNQENIPKSIELCFQSIACRAAVKGGKNAGVMEQEYIVKMVQEDTTISYCPHGRPVMVEISKSKLERMFGRIV